MSLRQHYTWNDFKREQGDKAKDLKRTSPEGLKAFDAARKAKLKALVAERMKTAKQAKDKAEKASKTLRDSLKGLKGPRRKKVVIARISQAGRRAAHFQKQLTRDEARDA